MRTVERDIDRILTLLRNRIREHGFIQRDIQEKLGWGRSYISQLLNKQKGLQVEQVLLILKVIGAKPGDFWAEIFQLGAIGEPNTGRRSVPDAPRTGALFQADAGGSPADELCRLAALYKGLVRVLMRKNFFTADALKCAIDRAKRNSDGPISGSR